MDSQIKVLDEAQKVTGLIFNGRLDVGSRELVKEDLHNVLTSPALLIVVDLKNVPFIDSSGLSALVSGLRVAREQKKDIILASLNKQAQMVFHLTMMDRVFTIYSSMEEALNDILN